MFFLIELQELMPCELVILYSGTWLLLNSPTSKARDYCEEVNLAVFALCISILSNNLEVSEMGRILADLL